MMFDSKKWLKLASRSLATALSIGTSLTSTLVYAETLPETPSQDTQQEQKKSKEDVESQPEIIVVRGSVLGNSEVADLKNYTGNRSIITHEQMERTAVRSIDTALQQVPGIKVKDETGTGVSPNISIRGLDSSRSGYAQFLLDGIPLTLAPYSHTGQSLFPATLSMIDRIDVARGGASVQYGPNNVGGVINLITKPISDEWETSLNEKMTFSGNDNLLYDTSVSTGGALTEDFSARLDVNNISGNAFRDHSSTDVTNIMLKTVWNINENNSLSTSFQYYNAFAELPGALNTAAYNEDRTQSLRQNDQYTGDSKRATVSYSHVLDESSLFDEGELDITTFGNKSTRKFVWDYCGSDSCSSWADTTQDPTALRDSPREFTVFGIEPKASFYIDGDTMTQNIIAGTRYVNEDVSYELNSTDNDSGDTTSVRDWQMDTNAMAYYISNTLGFFDDTVTITPGLRLEDVNMTFNNLGAGYSQSSRVTEWLPGLTLGYQVASDWFLYANSQRSLRTPQISQLWPKGQTLDSELSWNYETGVRFTPTIRSNISLALYRIDFDNKIEYNSDTSLFTNIGSTRSQGVEVQGTFSPMSLPDLTISGSYNYLDTEQLSGDYIGNELTYASKHQVSASVLYNLNEINLGLMGYYYGPSYADLANTVEENDSGTVGRMPGYTVVNMNVSKEIFNEFTLGFSVNNLFDNEYYFRGLDVSPAGRIPAPGRSFTVSLGYNF
ncbi:TonB-dependent receptor family protein [Shewanella surugensis]|uniref:TonB-dependent siderophore receptor n=1 Tax=Shewanella surugensis TaxID=212020 RepID=A0ABT0LCX7_9GAMM|nr:TonB-dependent siderophore receptor [Shewanella surugensis]MCL1125424.1 TonB-dependent siderophore receptor [Shewanella surugensis]